MMGAADSLKGSQCGDPLFLNRRSESASPTGAADSPNGSQCGDPLFFNSRSLRRDHFVRICTEDRHLKNYCPFKNLIIVELFISIAEFSPKAFTGLKILTEFSGSSETKSLKS